jgi:hypothetical protein
MNRRRNIRGPVVLLGLLGCVSPAPKTPAFEVPAQWDDSAEILIGPITDLRDTRGRGPTYLGTIRGGYGNALERIHLDVPAADHLVEQLRAVLSNHGIATSRASEQIRAIYAGGWTLRGDFKGHPPIVVGAIRRYWAENVPWRLPFGGRRVEVAFDLVLLSTDDARPLWAKTLARTEDDHGSVGLLGSNAAAPLSTWLTAVVQELVAEAIDDPEFLGALRSP